MNKTTVKTLSDVNSKGISTESIGFLPFAGGRFKLSYLVFTLGQSSKYIGLCKFSTKDDVASRGHVAMATHFWLLLVSSC